MFAMNDALRRSLPSKLTAIGFIVLIVSGNFWLVNALISKSPSTWVGIGFMVGSVLTMAGAIGLLTLALYRRFFVEQDGTAV